MRSTLGDRGAPPHSQRCASAAAHLEETQKVDRRGEHVLRLGVRDECLPTSVALDRRELHTSDLRSFGESCFHDGKSSKIGI
jgi:hypothetical protein